MKCLLFLWWNIFCSLCANAQGPQDFSLVDYKALSIPAAITNSTKGIADYIGQHFTGEKEKSRAIYKWVTTNIQYSTDSMYSINWGGNPESKITEALRRKKGVCENYAAIFTDIATRCGLQSFVISGYTKQLGIINKTGHSWCAVNIEKEWLLCDPTWDAGFNADAHWFLISPAAFIETHMPFDPLWQLLEQPISDEDFYRGRSHSSKDKSYFNVADSVKSFLQLDSLRRLESSARRMQALAEKNELQKNWKAYVAMKIAIVYEDKDMDLYNSAVADLNRVTAIYNAFIQYRNSRFILVKPDAELAAMLEPVAAILSAAWEKTGKIGKTVESQQYDTGDLRHQLSILTGRVQAQQDFLKRYLAVDPATREQLFYQ